MSDEQDSTRRTGATTQKIQDSSAAQGKPPTQRLKAQQDTTGSRRSNLFLGLLIALLVLTLLLLAGFMLGDFTWLSNQIAGEPSPSARMILQNPTARTVPTAAIAVRVATPTPLPMPAVGAEPGPPPAVSERFQAYYDQNGGLRMFGLPLSAPLTINGREVQWFERARLEHWPEFAGTPYEIQAGRLGVEYTQGRNFSDQEFFASTGDLRFVPETRHGLGGRFLSYWEQNGGLSRFGYPISDEFDEVLADGKTYRVQYFERVRLEYHPEHEGTEHEVQVGLLGRALYMNDSRPVTIPPAPTAVPMP